MKNKFFIYIVGALMGLAMTTAVVAMPLAYDEAVDGDIVSHVVLGSLDFGANTVTGTVNGILSPSVGADFDIFSVLLPTLGVLDSIEIFLSDGVNGNGALPNSFGYYINGVANVNFSLNFGSTVYMIGLSPDELTIIGMNGINAGMEIDYTITFNVSAVSAVPVPAALPLFGTGLAVLGLIGWRRKRKAA